MRYLLSVPVAASAFVSTVSAMALETSKSGCRVAMTSTLADPSSPGENILMKTMIKWTDTTDTPGFQSTYCDWSDTASPPFSVLFYENMIPGYETAAELSSVLDGWVNTWLVSKTDKPNSGVVGDYNITSVVCS